MDGPFHILYCHCAYARIVPEKVKEEVLQKLSELGIAFDAVADLCEMSARRDPVLKNMAAAGQIKIAACYPRAVRWLFSAAEAPLPQAGVEVLNMRVESAAVIVKSLLGDGPCEAPAQSLSSIPEASSFQPKQFSNLETSDSKEVKP